jgi:uncharacterized protein YndB with AHSA1/START domain
MPDIVHELRVLASPDRVFDVISTPDGLDRWWTLRSSGEPRRGATFELRFGPDYDWRAVVRRYEPDEHFELEMTEAHPDWLGTRLQFDLRPADEGTQLKFTHVGWPADNEHYRVSCYCWAMYLRLLRRAIEHGEFVPYADRLDV